MVSGSANACSREAMLTPSPNTSPSRWTMSPRVDADADVNLFGAFLLGVVSAELGLNLLRALHGVDDGREVHQKGIADGFDDRAVMVSYGLLNEVIMDVEQAQHAGFVAAHLAAKADDVGEHDRREPPILRVHRAAGVFLHGYGLFCWCCLTVNLPSSLMRYWIILRFCPIYG